MPTRRSVVLLAVLVSSCGGKAKAPTPPSPPPLLIQPPFQSVFASHDFHSSPAESTAFSTHATSFLNTPLDTSVIERVVQSRLKDATREALDDLLHKAGVSVNSKPAKDLVDAITSLIAESADGEARSQTLVAGLLRVGLTGWIAKLVQTNAIPAGGCTDEIQMLDAIYEGLASTQYLRPLGFPKSEGTFASDACAKLGGNIAMLADTLARFPDVVKKVPLIELSKAVSKLSDAAEGGCDSKVQMLLPAEAQGALARVQQGLKKPATCDNSATGTPDATKATCKLDVTVLREVYDSVKLVKSFANGLASPEKPAYGKCLDTFVKFGQLFEDDLLRFSADVDPGINLADLQNMLGTVRAFAMNVQTKYGAELAAIQSLLVRLIDGRALRRGDVVLLLRFVADRITPKLVVIDPPEAGSILVAVIETLPVAIREDATAPAGIRMDIPVLASTIVSRFARQTRAGLYLRATVGTGYALTVGEGSRNADTITTFHEELGFGYRWQCGSLLHGPHLITSGILFNIVENDATSHRLFLGGGYSINLYHLIDISTSVGRFFDLKANGSDTGVLLSLQIPIFDYLSALTEGGEVGQASSSQHK